MKCDELIAPCEYAKEKYKEAFKLVFNSEDDYKKIHLLGQPRCDIFSSLYKFPLDLFTNIEELNNYKKKYNFIISWLPTHRKGQNKNILNLIEESNLNLSGLNSFCKSNNILFIIKPHFLEINIIQNITQNFDNIVINKDTDPYPLLKYTDILITDYSSVYFDFLLTNKPIIFTPFDLKEYIKYTNFYESYEHMTPGIKCFTWDEVINEINSIICLNDKYKQIRQNFLKEINIVSNSSKLILKKYFS